MKINGKLLYVGFNQLNSSALKAFKTRVSDLVELVPLAVSPRVIEPISNWLPRNVVLRLKSRQYLAPQTGVKRIVYGYLNLPNQFFKKRIFKSMDFAEIKWRTIKINQLQRNVDLIVLPGDYLREFKGDLSRTLLEIRGCHSSILDKRGPVLLNCPFPEQKLTWEKEFSLVSGKYKGIIVYSDIAAESFQRSNLEINKIYKVPLIAPKVNPVDLTILTHKPRSLLYVGRGSIEKGLDIAISVANTLRLEITVIGNFKPEMELWIRQQSGVNFKGSMSRIEVLNAMREHEVYLGTSIESFGYSTLEAIQSGMKIVGTPFIGALNWYPMAPNLFMSETLDVETISSKVSQAFESDFDPCEDFSEIDPYPFWLKMANDSF